MKPSEGFLGPGKESMADVVLPRLYFTKVDVIGSELKRLLLEGNGKSNVDLNEKEDRNTKFRYPQRPNESDCSYYLKTGSCRYGSNCKFNHPLQRNSKENGDFKENEESQQEQQEEFPERVGQPECKYYMKTGDCKFGKACRFHHPREKNAALLTLNFIGLPYRPGEKNCPYYMRTGFCKFAVHCRFHHPDPTATVESDIDHGYDDDRSVPIPLHGPGVSPQPNTTWPCTSTSNETASFYDLSLPYIPVMPQSTSVYQNPDWNGLQGSFMPSLQGAQPSVSNDPNMTSNYSLNQRQMSIEEFPERPGQPECQFFMRNGDCKFRSACKYHHPKNQTIKSPGCVLSPLGLPLRPDQTVCMHYSRFGICKFGPSCKFDHPMDHGSSSTTSPVMVHLNGNLSMGETRMAA